MVYIKHIVQYIYFKNFNQKIPNKKESEMKRNFKKKIESNIKNIKFTPK